MYFPKAVTLATLFLTAFSSSLGYGVFKGENGPTLLTTGVSSSSKEGQARELFGFDLNQELTYECIGQRYREIVRQNQLHPDQEVGDSDEFVKFTEARDLLQKLHPSAYPQENRRDEYADGLSGDEDALNDRKRQIERLERQIAAAKRELAKEGAELQMTRNGEWIMGIFDHISEQVANHATFVSRCKSVTECLQQCTELSTGAFNQDNTDAQALGQLARQANTLATKMTSAQESFTLLPKLIFNGAEFRATRATDGNTLVFATSKITSAKITSSKITLSRAPDANRMRVVHTWCEMVEKSREVGTGQFRFHIYGASSPICNDCYEEIFTTEWYMGEESRSEELTYDVASGKWSKELTILFGDQVQGPRKSMKAIASNSS